MIRLFIWAFLVSCRQRIIHHLLGIYIGGSLIGPVLGYIGGGAMLRLYGGFLFSDR